MKKLSVMLMFVMFAVSANAGVELWSENFDDDALGAYDDGAGPWNGDGNAGYQIVEDTGDLFGGGTSNQIMKLYTDGSQQYKSWVNVVPIIGGPTEATWSFDLYQITGGAIWTTTGKNAPAGGGRFAGAKWENGTLNGAADAYALNTAVHVDLVCSSLDAKMYVYVDGVLEATVNRMYAIEAITGLKINVRTTAQGQLAETYIDNLTLSAVPEPASMALLGLGSIAALRRRRK